MPSTAQNTSSNYNPFGSAIESRAFASGEYRYGFQSMEKDDEVKGSGNSYTTEFRQYDPRIGRWLSIDPKAYKYPHESPYVAFHNNPIYWTDPRGDDPPKLKEVIKRGQESKTFVQLMDANDITERNAWRRITISDRTYTHPKRKKVVIQGQELNQTVLNLTHELTNLKNQELYGDLRSAIKEGEITPDEYAEQALSLESEAHVNKLIVASELGEDIEGTTNNILIEQYKKGEIDKEGMIDEVRGKMKDMVITDTGENAYEFYKKQGEKYQKKKTSD
jgi:RHS repeat-associated protein